MSWLLGLCLVFSGHLRRMEVSGKHEAVLLWRLARPAAACQNEASEVGLDSAVVDSAVGSSGRASRPRNNQCCHLSTLRSGVSEAVVWCLQAIRRESDSRALVLLDEVGTGTDPGEGAALGVALLHALIRGGFGGASFTMATTHHR